MDKIDELLTRGVDKIYPSKEALESILRSGKKLRLYQGFDPTGPLLHIGHMVGLMKLRQFQLLGHHVIFLIGDFTGMIGDPTGKSESRKPITREEVLANAKFYKEQTVKILNYSGQNPVEVKYNSEWLSKITAPELLKLSSYITYQQIIERDMFQERKKKGLDINMTEFLYPVLQGYDSVAMDVDLELGGSDQMFNMLVGRDLLHKIKKKEKFVITTPLLTDSSGKKIGKTEGNVIALTSPPNDFYGMVMALPDDVIVKCFEYLTDIPMEEIKEIEQKMVSGANPIQYKKQLAFSLAEMLNDTKTADAAQTHFERTFQKRELPKDVSVIRIAGNVSSTIIDVLTATKLVGSKSEAKRLIAAGAVEINGEKCKDQNILLSSEGTCTIRVGKHTFAKIITE